MSSANESIIKEEVEGIIDSDRGRIVALAVKDACNIASLRPNHQDWNAACRFILQNKLLTEKEKNDIVNLFCYK
jgi:hypothetical protein